MMKFFIHFIWAFFIHVRYWTNSKWGSWNITNIYCWAIVNYGYRMLLDKSKMKYEQYNSAIIKKTQSIFLRFSTTKCIPWMDDLEENSRNIIFVWLIELKFKKLNLKNLFTNNCSLIAFWFSCWYNWYYDNEISFDFLKIILIPQFKLNYENFNNFKLLELTQYVDKLFDESIEKKSLKSSNIKKYNIHWQYIPIYFTNANYLEMHR